MPTTKQVHRVVIGNNSDSITDTVRKKERKGCSLSQDYIANIHICVQAKTGVVNNSV